jgi:hypothetical protein
MGAQPPGLSVLLDATGCTTAADAVEWIGEGHPVDIESDRHALLQALVSYASEAYFFPALRRLAREVASSDLDSAAVLFEPGTIVSAADVRRTLDRIASKCAGRTLAGINSSAVIASQRDDSATVAALCAVAGVSYSELQLRVPGLPAHGAGSWSPSQLRRAFELIDALVRDEVSAELPGTVPARALELMQSLGDGAGWQAVEGFRVTGVPYEALLAQRINGGAWLAHRNRTSNKLAPLLARRLCDALDARTVAYRLSGALGGDTPPKVMSALSGCDHQIGLLVEHNDAAVFAVIFSSARDSGTASKNAGRLRAMRRAVGLPIAIVVAGPGWAARNETADLALDFSGLLYSESALDVLADEIGKRTTT